MDGVIVDLSDNISKWFSMYPDLKFKYEKYPDHIPGIFRNPKPIKGSISSINELVKSKKYELFIATSAPWGNPESLTDKRYWIENYFGNIFHKKLIITHRKDLLIGDFLIDDRKKNGAINFTGQLISFGSNWETGKENRFKDWDSVLKFLL